jgi:aspartate racemase
MTAKHIGIVACSAEGAALCYQTICKESEQLMGEHFHPEITMHTHSLGEYMVLIREEDWHMVGKLILSSVEKLNNSGADFVICPDNTIHQSLPLIENQSPLPWLHIADIVAQKAGHEGYQKLALLGTKYLMEGPVYPDILKKYNATYMIPDEDTRIEINRIIFSELVKGIFKKESQRYFYQVIGELKKKQCQAVILGCTEIPLIVNESDSPLPTLDSARLLARAAIKYALNQS